MVIIMTTFALTVCKLQWFNLRVCSLDDMVFDKPLHRLFHKRGESHRPEALFCVYTYICNCGLIEIDKYLSSFIV